MIHYTLLPEKEIQSLKKEYRTRLIIVGLFFISCSIVIGITSLIPSYIRSSSQEKEILGRLLTLQNDSHERGTDTIMKELATTDEIMQRIKTNQNNVVFSNFISEINSYRSQKLTISSFQLNKSTDISSSTKGIPVDIIIQGKSATREALLDFKNKLESDPFISEVELPVSDLAKSKDILFAIKLTINSPSK